VLTKNTTAVVEITMQRVICIEEYKAVKSLGRFMLRDKGATIAAGIVVEVCADAAEQ
jgi:elongation factor 1 alpha-like protein